VATSTTRSRGGNKKPRTGEPVRGVIYLLIALDGFVIAGGDREDPDYDNAAD
jgi:hypothetical protein